jgi:serine/threonine protein kinase
MEKMMLATHPSPDDLTSFALGRLDAADAQVVADHLAACTRCESQLITVPDDPLLSLIRSVLVADTVSPDRSAVETASPPAWPATGAVSARFPTIPGYQVLGLLGSGGMGDVYRARDDRLKREVALKVMRRAGDPSSRARFQTEAEAVARLRHPHIVQIHEVGQWQPPGQSDPAPYLSLEFVPGGNLQAVLRDGPLSPDEASHLLEVLARAMHAAHAAGLVHRDLKPANVLLADPVPGNSGSLRFGFPRIADFGLVRQLDADQRLSVEGQVMGTPTYMAPEQAEGQSEVGPPADVWALGVILYEALTGRVPFQGANITATLSQVCQAQPKPLRQLRGEVPAGLESICLRCLEKDPARRYPSAAALADDLARFRSAGPLLQPTGSYSPAPAPSPRHNSGLASLISPPTPPPPRLSRRSLLLGATGLTLALATGGLLFWRPWQARIPSPEQQPDTLPPLKGDLDVVIYESSGVKIDEFEAGSANRQRLRLHDRLALPLRPRDWIRIDATVTRPAYLYVIWIGTDGTATPLWPWLSPDRERLATWTDPRAEELPRDRLTLPRDAYSKKDIMPLGEGPPGVETLLLLARDRVLSDDDVADLARLLAPQARKPVVDMVLALWLENGDRVLDEANRAPIVGKGQDTRDVEQQVRTVMRQVHERLGYVRGVCFGNLGKGKK